MALDPVAQKGGRSSVIPSLNGLRALSILIVFLSHAGLEHIVPGLFGVTVFFFLSGYLITTLLRLEYAKRGRISLRDFYLRRILRILPPFYLVLALTTLTALSGFLPPRDEFQGPLLGRAVFFQSVHLANYYAIVANNLGIPPGTEVNWSLAVEEHFYLLFPVVYLLLRRRGCSSARMALIFMAVCLVVLAWRCAIRFGFNGNSAWTMFGTDTRLDALLFGCMLAVYGNPWLDASRYSERTWKFVFLPLGLVTLIGTFLFRNDDFRQTFRYTIQSIALIPVFVTAVRFSTWAPCRLLNIAPLRLLGLLSYSLYLVHYQMIQLVRVHVSDWRPVYQVMLAFCLSLLASMMIYVVVERPCARLRQRLSHISSAVKPSMSNT